MKKLIGILACAAALTAAAGLAACDKTTFPDFINSENDLGNKYVISVTSKGGMNLDGVKVSVLKDNKVVQEGYTEKGKVAFPLNADSYELQFSELPEGYIDDGSKHFVTETQKRYTAVFESELLPADNNTHYYSIGSIMHDFTFTDCYGKQYVLSDLLTEHKAVVLNLFYTGCGPCKLEFPAIEKAYNQFKDAENSIELLAISTAREGDDNSMVATFKSEYGLSFPMGVQTETVDSFSVSGYPTTVVIDRYGMVAYSNTGSETSETRWVNLFQRFTSDDYSQTGTTTGEGGETGGNTELIRPTVTMPASSVIAETINGKGVSGNTYYADDGEYSWPFTVANDEDCIVASNVGVDNSLSLIYTDITLNKGEMLCYEYKVYSEADYDILHVIVNGNSVAEHSGTSKGDVWMNNVAYVATRTETVTLVFSYIKDEADLGIEAAKETAKIRNIHIESTDTIADPTDAIHPVATVKADGLARYENYEKVGLNTTDGYYHLLDESGAPNGPLLLLTYLDNMTQWTKIHRSSYVTVQNETTSYKNSLYNILFYEYATGSEADIKLILNGINYTDTFLNTYYWSVFADQDIPGTVDTELIGYVPVTPELKELAVAFCKADSGNATHDNEWLEFCYYFNHYGPYNDNHTHDDCRVFRDPTKGMATHNAYELNYSAEDANSKKTVTYPVVVDRPLAQNRGTYYRFTAPKAGVYQIASQHATAKEDPFILIRDKDGKFLYSQDDALDYDLIFNTENRNNFNVYWYFDEGETYYLLMAMQAVQATGEYELKITYLDESYSAIIVCTTDEGMYVANGDDWNDVRYGAIDVAYDGQVYKQLTHDGDYGSTIYVDFLHQNYFESTGKTLRQMIEGGAFDNLNGKNYTAKMKTYYNQSIAGKSTDDPYYGLLAANSEIANILHELCVVHQAGGGDGDWLQFACYERVYGKDYPNY